MICEFQIGLLGRTLMYCRPLCFYSHCQPNDRKNSSSVPWQEFLGWRWGNQRWEERPGGDEGNMSYSKSL